MSFYDVYGYWILFKYITNLNIFDYYYTVLLPNTCYLNYTGYHQSVIEGICDIRLSVATV